MLINISNVIDIIVMNG